MTRIIHPRQLLAVVALAALFTVIATCASGCFNANARSQLFAANDIKDSLNRSLDSAIANGVVTPKPEEATAIRLASESTSAALDAAELYVNPDGTGAAGFNEAMDAVDAAIAYWRKQLSAADVPHK